MRITITEVDYAPADLYDQVPFTVELDRRMPSDDRPDYWLGSVSPPLTWLVENLPREVTHVILAARWAGTAIEPGMASLPVGIGFVKDATLLDDDRLDFTKCTYVAIGSGSDASGREAPPPSHEIQVGRIQPGFGTGKSGDVEGEGE